MDGPAGRLLPAFCGRHPRRGVAIPTHRSSLIHAQEPGGNQCWRPFDDGYLIQADPPGPGGAAPKLASWLVDEANEFFSAHGEELLDYQDALFVNGERLQHSTD